MAERLAQQCGATSQTALPPTPEASFSAAAMDTPPRQRTLAEKLQSQYTLNLLSSKVVRAYAEQEGAVYITIRGKPCLGIIVDPGASDGLLGTETLREWVQHIYGPRGMKYQCGKSEASCTGISGETDPSCGELVGNIGVCGLPRNTTYRGDLIGGNGSRCPALLPNTTLLEQRAIIYENMFPSGDGILAILPP
eukprot:4828314-Pyramimonas_sp.AAC.1